MKYVVGAVFAILAALAIAIPAVATTLPAPTGFINDFAGVLTQEQKSTFEASLSAYEKQSGNEIAVALVKSLNGDTVENVAVKVFEEWKIGKKDKDNGVLFFAAINDRKMRIEVGYGLESLLTDAESGDIIRTVIAPKFRANDYYAGLTQGVAAIEQQLSGSAAQPTAPRSSVSSLSDDLGVVFWIIVFLFFLFHTLFVYTCAFLARSKSIWLGGIIGGLIGVFIGVFFVSLLVSIVAAGVFGGLGLLLDWYLSRRYKLLKKAGKPTDWWSSGGGFWGGGASGGDGGGFGGFGGGGSGGGGASGGW